jgi:hypothetical protein
LVRLLEQLSPSGRSYFSYHLLYDPGLKYYLIDISAVQPKVSQAESGLITATPPAPVGTFGSKPAKKQ